MQLRERLGVLVGGREGAAQLQLRVEALRQRDRGVAQSGQSVGGTAQRQQRHAQVILRLGERGIERGRAFQVRERLLDVALTGQQTAQRIGQGRRVGRAAKRLLDTGARLGSPPRGRQSRRVGHGLLRHQDGRGGGGQRLAEAGHRGGVLAQRALRAGEVQLDAGISRGELVGAFELGPRTLELALREQHRT